MSVCKGGVSWANSDLRPSPLSPVYTGLEDAWSSAQLTGLSTPQEKSPQSALKLVGDLLLNREEISSILYYILR